MVALTLASRTASTSPERRIAWRALALRHAWGRRQRVI